MGRKGSGLIQNLDHEGGSPRLCRLRPTSVGLNEKALECTNTYGIYGIPKLSSFVCR
jgi:hypothetical protein